MLPSWTSLRAAGGTRFSWVGAGTYPEDVQLSFTGEVFEWRGPSPYFFVKVPDEPSAAIEAASALLTYGWGVIPVTVRSGTTQWTTSLFPKDGGYLVPLKDKVRKAEGLQLGAIVELTLELAV